jgi:hypothetical protein
VRSTHSPKSRMRICSQRTRPCRRCAPCATPTTFRSALRSLLVGAHCTPAPAIWLEGSMSTAALVTRWSASFSFGSHVKGTPVLLLNTARTCGDAEPCPSGGSKKYATLWATPGFKSLTYAPVHRCNASIQCSGITTIICSSAESVFGNCRVFHAPAECVLAVLRTRRR